MKKMCCEAMEYFTSNHCEVHNSPFECPDCLLLYDEKSNDYGIIIHDGGQSFVKIKYCPWCGSTLFFENEIYECLEDGLPNNK